MLSTLLRRVCLSCKAKISNRNISHIAHESFNLDQRNGADETRTSVQFSSELLPYEIDLKFVSKYRNIAPPFGFNGLGELVYLRTYAR